MKQTLFIFCISLLVIPFAGCDNGAQNEAVKQADLIQKTMKENSPGTIATSDNGYYMTAKIDGKEWSASHMVPDNDERSSYKMIRGENDGDNINFQLWKQGVEVGKKRTFSETNAAGIFIADDPALISGQAGEVEITRLDEQWLEGTYHFTATSGNSNKKVEVTDGRFRVASGLK